MDRLQDLHIAAAAHHDNGTNENNKNDGKSAKSPRSGRCASGVNKSTTGSTTPPPPRRQGKGRQSQHGKKRSSSPATLTSPIPAEEENATLAKIMTCFRDIVVQLAVIRELEGRERERVLTGNTLISANPNNASPSDDVHREQGVTAENGAHKERRASTGGSSNVQRIQAAFQSAQSSLLRAYKLRPLYWEETNALRDHISIVRAAEKGLEHGNSQPPSEPVQDSLMMLEQRVRQREDKTQELEKEFTFFLDQLWTAEREHRELLISDVARQLKVRLQVAGPEHQQQIMRQLRASRVAAGAGNSGRAAPSPSTSATIVKNSGDAAKKKTNTILPAGGKDDGTTTHNAKYTDLDALDEASDHSGGGGGERYATSSASVAAGGGVLCEKCAKCRSQRQQPSTSSGEHATKDGKNTSAAALWTDDGFAAMALSDAELYAVAERLIDRSQATQQHRRSHSNGSAHEGEENGDDEEDAMGVALDTQVFNLSAYELQSALETRDAIVDIEHRMQHLYQLFSDVSLLVHAQGEQLDCVAKNIDATRERVTRGREELKKAKHYKRSCGCGCCCAVM